MHIYCDSQCWWQRATIRPRDWTVANKPQIESLGFNAPHPRCSCTGRAVREERMRQSVIVLPASIWNYSWSTEDTLIIDSLSAGECSKTSHHLSAVRTNRILQKWPVPTEFRENTETCHQGLSAAEPGIWRTKKCLHFTFYPHKVKTVSQEACFCHVSRQLGWEKITAAHRLFST